MITDDTLDKALNSQGRYLYEIKGDELHITHTLHNLNMIFSKTESGGYMESKRYITTEAADTIRSLGYGLKRVSTHTDGIYCHEGSCLRYTKIKDGNYSTLYGIVNASDDIELVCHVIMSSAKIIHWKGIEYHLGTASGVTMNSPVVEVIKSYRQVRVIKMVYTDRDYEYTVVDNKVLVKLHGTRPNEAVEWNIESETLLPIYIDNLERQR